MAHARTPRPAGRDLYALPLGRGGEPPDASDVVRIALSGDFSQVGGGAPNAIDV